MGNWGVRARHAWPFVAMGLAVVLWWPAGFAGRASWMHLSLMQTENGIVPLSGGDRFTIVQIERLDRVDRRERVMRNLIEQHRPFRPSGHAKIA